MNIMFMLSVFAFKGELHLIIKWMTKGREGRERGGKRERRRRGEEGEEREGRRGRGEREENEGRRRREEEREGEEGEEGAEREGRVAGIPGGWKPVVNSRVVIHIFHSRHVDSQCDDEKREVNYR